LHYPKNETLKLSKQIIVLLFAITTLSSCSLFNSIFGGGANKNGCPSNGKNVGAEKLLRGDSKNKKDKVPSAPKYKLNKF
jgi:hypothetical protein